ncbi:MAG: phosphoribosylanthranilate isomerase [Anaerolineae bacterium]|nr:phosphoribosylanthranilate isomerase [Thermoflexales bacterium]MDW8054459.1 phosphoribosylanthranilate isomerase [Anaerolineae bacterium]
MIRVKICGITNQEDALIAAEAGADFLGFIFYPPSPRAVTPARAASIVAAVRRAAPHVRCVGVFVQPSPDAVEDVMRQVGLDAAQLHGATLQTVQALGRRAYLAVKAWDDTAQAAAACPADDLPQVLLDAAHPTLWGGTGLRADEHLAQALARAFRLLLAGGLTPENVAEVVQRVQPWGVDVASGVELAPGRKDPARVRAFVQAAKQWM